MSVPRRWGTAAVLGVLVLAGLPAADVAVTVYCDDGDSPYCYGVDGVAQGAYVEVLQRAFSRLSGYKVTIKPLPWKRALGLLEDGTGFALFPPYRLPKERPWMDYTLKLYEERVVLLLNARGRVPLNAVWPEDFRGLTVGINLGFAFLERWKGLFQIDEAPDNATALRKLALLRDDAYANDRIVMLATVRDLKARGEIPPDTPFVEGPLVSREVAYLGITNQDRGRFPFKADFVRQMAAILEAMTASGEISRTMERYWK